MSETHVSTEDHHEPRLYEIRLKGHLDARWADRFEGLSFTHESDGITILSGPVVDQAALHGLLRKVRNLGLTLISIHQIDSNQSKGSDGNTDKTNSLKRREKDENNSQDINH
ncbi:hypothetical protein J2Y03_002926 [Neobacillus niacini]|uniref:hypothetical protein n=1 Tax=Neobacillus niacini TaxID=86668 RepID=UPI0028607085|nr:hypothetical protein [Neobacillus niacini]MDR7077900.1 hypothetical protein [Neobacillus niacini]